MVWHIHAPQGFESAKIRENARLYLAGKGLDIGCGQQKVIPHALGIDQARGAGIPVADLASDGTKLDWMSSETQDFVFSSHFLEHVVDYKAALKEWWRVLKVGGYLILYLPHKDFYPNIGQPGANPDHKHDFHPDDIKKAMFEVIEDYKKHGFDVLEDEDRNNDNEYSFYLVFRKRDDADCTYNPWSRSPHRGGKNVVVARYGAIGDMALVTSVVALYKAQGFRVYVSTTPKGYELVKHDPNIDEFLLHECDGSFWIGTMEPYWRFLAQRYGRLINLTQSVEGILLPSDEHLHHDYPLDVRQRLLNVNYMERTHDIAGLPYDFAGLRFHPSAIEQQSAANLWFKYTERFMHGDNGEEIRVHVPVLGVCLAGSAVHKAYPFLHVVIARVMLETSCNVVLFGGEEDQVKEDAVFQHCVAHGIDPRRLIRTINDKWDIRRSLAFSAYCDVLFGPETGLMQWNAVGRNIKIIMLSHSTEENLTKHWTNVTPIIGKVPCGPCHRKHNNWKYCTQGKSGAALCMEIPVAPVAGAIINAIQIVETRALEVAPQAAATANGSGERAYAAGEVVQAEPPFLAAPERISPLSERGLGQANTRVTEHNTEQRQSSIID